MTQKYPKKTCDSCGYLAQLEFDPFYDWIKIREAECPECQSYLFSDIVSKQLSREELEDIKRQEKVIMQARMKQDGGKKYILYNNKRKKYKGPRKVKGQWKPFAEFQNIEGEDRVIRKRRYAREWTRQRRKEMREQFGKALY